MQHQWAKYPERLHLGRRVLELKLCDPEHLQRCRNLLEIKVHDAEQLHAEWIYMDEQKLHLDHGCVECGNLDAE
jgi:hypothetical protein